MHRLTQVVPQKAYREDLFHCEDPHAVLFALFSLQCVKALYSDYDLKSSYCVR